MKRLDCNDPRFGVFAIWEDPATGRVRRSRNHILTPRFEDEHRMARRMESQFLRLNGGGGGGASYEFGNGGQSMPAELL